MEHRQSVYMAERHSCLVPSQDFLMYWVSKKTLLFPIRLGRWWWRWRWRWRSYWCWCWWSGHDLWLSFVIDFVHRLNLICLCQPLVVGDDHAVSIQYDVDRRQWQGIVFLLLWFIIMILIIMIMIIMINSGVFNLINYFRNIS